MFDYNLYIDESCHLEHDLSNIMAVGYIKVPSEEVPKIKTEIKQIKRNHGIVHEIKWNTISNTKGALYKELIDYFFDKPLQFRCLLIKHKNRLQHQKFNEGRHDIYYDKMIFYLLANPWLNNTSDNYKVFLDIKDTRGREKLKMLDEIFRNKFYGNSPYKWFQHIRSFDSQFIQLADIFIGAITYKARGLQLADGANKTKIELVQYLEQKSGYDLDFGTAPWESKFNIFDHQPRRVL
ncbi:MAG: DUF3800 domain-containing protein [Bacteroidetes bacterium]|nr:DUF3800 domain-containing protein [Bacteroidota bacterium]